MAMVVVAIAIAIAADAYQMSVGLHFLVLGKFSCVRCLVAHMVLLGARCFVAYVVSLRNK